MNLSTLEKILGFPLIVFIVAFTISTAEMSFEMYLPTLPSVCQTYLGNCSVIQLSVGLNLLAITISGLFYGAIADIYGRRKVVLFGIALFTLCSFLCALKLPLYVFVAVHTLQGAGSSVALIIVVAIIDDLFEENKAAQVTSFVSIVYAISSAIAPVVGSNVAAFLSWNYNFLILGVLGSICFITFYQHCPETLKEKPLNKTVWDALRGYAELLCVKRFALILFLQCVIIGSFWVFWSSESLVFVDHLGVPVHIYGYYMSFGVMAYVIAALINQRLLVKTSINKLILFGIFLMIVGCITLTTAAVFVPDYAFVQRLSILPASCGLAFIATNAITVALEQVPEKTGSAAALITCIEMGFGAFGSFMMSFIGYHSIVPVAGIMFIGCLIALTLYYLFERDKHNMDEPIMLGDKGSF